MEALCLGNRQDSLRNPEVVHGSNQIVRGRRRRHVQGQFEIDRHRLGRLALGFRDAAIALELQSFDDQPIVHVSMLRK